MLQPVVPGMWQQISGVGFAVGLARLVFIVCEQVRRPRARGEVRKELERRVSKVAYLALQAWGDASRGAWPDLVPPDRRHAYDLPTIKRWLEVFLVRFFRTSQFKRTAMPNGPKVGSGGSLSPRGGWRAPSDAEEVAWVDELRRKVP